MYTIGQVSEMFQLPVSTLRYYDKEGLFPHMTRVSGIRKFSDTEIECLRMIECLKKTGMEIKEIKQFMEWCAEGASTYAQRKELFENRFMNRVMTWLGAFPVSRGESDLSAMRTSLKLLADGEALGIFPEGHRYVDGEMHEFGNGLALIALRSGAPVVPAYIQGS